MPVQRYSPRNLISALLLWLVITMPACAGSQNNPPLKITYVASEGFLIECGDKKILIDALFGGFEASWCYVPSDSIVGLMTAAEPPFDDIDIIAVTHAHKDHVNSKIAAAHLSHNPKGILVCPPQVADQMKESEYYAETKDRIREVWVPFDTDTTVEIAGIKMHILSGHHGPYYDLDSSTGESVDTHRDVQHLEFLFTLNGRTLFHCGDAPMNDTERYRSFGIWQNNIDVAFVGWWDERQSPSFRQKLVEDIIKPDRIILMHLSPSRLPKGNPDRQKMAAKEIIVPQHSMETWTFE